MPARIEIAFLSLKNKIYSQNKKDKADKVIQSERFVFKEQQGECHKYNQCDDFLNNFQLNQRKRPPAFPEPNPVGRYLKHVFK